MAQNVGPLASHVLLLLDAFMKSINALTQIKRLAVNLLTVNLWVVLGNVVIGPVLSLHGSGGQYGCSGEEKEFHGWKAMGAATPSTHS